MFGRGVLAVKSMVNVQPLASFDCAFGYIRMYVYVNMNKMTIIFIFSLCVLAIKIEVRLQRRKAIWLEMEDYLIRWKETLTIFGGLKYLGNARAIFFKLSTGIRSKVLLPYLVTISRALHSRCWLRFCHLRCCVNVFVFSDLPYRCKLLRNFYSVLPVNSIGQETKKISSGINGS